MIFAGIDDTDSLESRGTNKLAKSLVAQLADRFVCRMIVRHQLLFDDRIPFTSHNGSASILLEPRDGRTLDEAAQAALFNELKAAMLSDFIPGSDPGLCLTSAVPSAIIDWGQRCQREIVTQAEARVIAEQHNIRLEGLGGTNGGIIGALAAIGLAATGNDGRLIHWNDQPDDLTGPVPAEVLLARGIEVRDATGFESEAPFTASSGTPVASGLIDVGKHARPNLRGHRAILFVIHTQSDSSTSPAIEWTALKVR